MTREVEYRILSDVLPQMLDNRYGIISMVREIPREPGSPDFFHFAAQTCSVQAFTQQKNFRISGGVATERGSALAKAVGEAIERYCSAVYDLEDFPLIAAADADFPFVAPGTFALYADWQYNSPNFEYKPFTSHSRVRWTPSCDVATGRTAYIPACAVYLPYTYYVGSGDTPILQPISTGLACHTSFERAAVSAICEVVERDAFTLFWQLGISPPQIIPESLSETNYDIVLRFERFGGQRVYLFDITTDIGIPAVLSVLRNPISGAPPLTFSAAAHPDPEVAVRKSLEELEHTRRYMSQIATRYPRLPAIEGHVNVVDQLSHLNYWCDHKHAHEADFVFSSGLRKEFDELPCFLAETPQANLVALAGKIAASGYRTFLVDVTSDDVRPLELRVVRAVIPGLHPLAMGHRWRVCGGRRLTEVPDAMGLRPRFSAAKDNPSPHPFP